ncbi:DinB family protein [Kribbella amoyensis]|uniref:DinB family protein n=1 Tax=Kribbella amoyensis TaxID=996641 RepID=UPI00119D9FE3|nr:DinB family protein [Kribbella amoyensis]
MTTTDDSAFRAEPPQVAGERELLQGFLDFHRGTLRWKISGLTSAQLVRPTVDPSPMSLLGLVRHLTEVERQWFEICLAERPIKPVLWTDEHPDGDFDLVEAAAAERDLAAYDAMVATSDKIVAGYDLDHTFRRPGRGDAEYSVRWLYLHMIEEYARHNGHADLLRERIDGLVGE